MVYEIFISYNTNDLKVANYFKDEFDKIQGVKTYLAERELPIGNLANNLINKIRNSDLVVLLYSKNSDNSKYVHEEIGVAKGTQRQIIPLLLDSETKLENMLAGDYYISFYDESKKPEQIEKLLTYIQKNIDDKNFKTFILIAGTIGVGWLVLKGLEK